MKIKALANTVASGKEILAGKTYDVSGRDGRTLIYLKKAVEVETPDENMSIQEAIESLDADNKDHWIKDGSPATEALEDLMGREVSATERNEAWKEYEIEE